MKHLFFCTILIFFTLNLLAQSDKKEKPKIDNRLYEVYSENYLQRLQDENPFLIQRWNYYLDHAWYIIEYPNEKKDAGYPSIHISNLDDFNIILLEKENRLERDFKKRKIYKIETTNKVLVFYSGEEFNKKLNKHLGREH
ncbi:MAG: hypothetical protein GY705_09345 [Bacteroidetes bacterium]|nr:hypothetical protein [Bacteroidota bacterium]